MDLIDRQDGDTISRQAAIDALKTAELGCDVEAIEALPSAEPVICRDCILSKLTNGISLSLPSSQPVIIRCRDCKHRDPEDKKCDCGHDILWQLPRQNDWYCADAERRTDG